MSSENSYLAALKEVYRTGTERETRNSKTISKFGITMKFDISESFPLLTTKKMYWKGIARELLWFIHGDTNAKHLQEEGVHIWDGNTSREFLDHIGLNHYEEGDCGPIYGFQWRHFNASYEGMHGNYHGKGVDQLQKCIDLIKNDPTSRRIFMSAWNPEQLDEMCLPPCHVSYQFYVNDDKLSCMMYQRSGDMFLGVPFNIASTALLTYMIAHVTNKKPENITIIVGDAHIYENHYGAVEEQLSREVYLAPKLRFVEKRESIEDILYEDMILEDYQFHGPIKAKMIA